MDAALIAKTKERKKVRKRSKGEPRVAAAVLRALVQKGARAALITGAVAAAVAGGEINKGTVTTVTTPRAPKRVRVPGFNRITLREMAAGVKTSERKV